MDEFQTDLLLGPMVRHVKKHEPTPSEIRLRRAVKKERGSICESCGAAHPLEQLSIHHIFETRNHPELACDRPNMIVLCVRCHASITDGEQVAGSTAIHFYSKLPAGVRRRHISYTESKHHAPPALLAAFRTGNETYWNDRAVSDLTK